MFDIDCLIQKALTSNRKIVSYVAKSKQGFPNIGANRTPHGVFPLIEYHQIFASDKLFASNRLVTRQYNYQVGIYSQDNDYYEIQDAVDKVMRSLGFTCYNDYTYTVDDSKVIHRIFSYTITLDRVMYQRLLNKLKISQ